MDKCRTILTYEGKGAVGVCVNDANFQGLSEEEEGEQFDEEEGYMASKHG
jgi:hypothetical protein